MIILVLDYTHTGILWKSKKAMFQLFGVHGKFVFFTWPCFGSDWEPPRAPPPRGEESYFSSRKDLRKQAVRTHFSPYLGTVPVIDVVTLVKYVGTIIDFKLTYISNFNCGSERSFRKGTVTVPYILCKAAEVDSFFYFSNWFSKELAKT